jgi:hypothetical protein
LIDWDAAWGRGDAMIAAVAQNLAPFLPERGAPSLTAVGLALFFGALALARHRRSGALAPWVAGLGALPVVYYVFFWAAHFYPRYTAPLAIFGLLALALAAARLGRFRAPTAIGAVALLAGVNAAAAVADLHSGRIGDGHAVTAGYVARRLPPPAKVGAVQSGVTGYYNDNVVNLDGKINQDALEAMRDGRIEDYVERSGIQYVVDWEGVILGLMPNALPSGRWVRCAAAVGNLETICIRRAEAPEP